MSGEPTLPERLEGLFALSLHAGTPGWDIWVPSRPVNDASFEDARVRVQAYSSVLREARAGAERPSISWLGAIHRATTAILTTSRPARPRLAKTVGASPDPRALRELDLVLEDLGARHPFVSAAEVVQQLELAAPYRQFGKVVSGLVLSALLARVGDGSLPLFPLFYRIFRLRNAPGSDEFERRATESRLDFTCYFLELLTQSLDAAHACEVAAWSRFAQDHQRLLDCPRATKLTFQLHAALMSDPVTHAAWVVERLGVSKPSANRAVDTLIDAGILVEVTGKLRDRYYRYDPLLQGLFEITFGDDASRVLENVRDVPR